MNIKKILVPTDFSGAANNALQFAVCIAEKYGSEIEIVNAYSFPVLTIRGTPVPPDPIVVEVNRRFANEQLEKTKMLVSDNHRVKIKVTAIPIYWQMELAEVIQSYEADLIVMGTTGASGLKKIFIGNNTARVIQNSPVPVLAVPEMAKLSQLNKIGFAYDGLEIKEFEKLSIIKAFSHVFQASIQIFQIKKSNQSTSIYLPELMNFLSGAGYIDIDESEIEVGILKFTQSNDLDMLVMMPRMQGFFDKLINGSVTENIAFEISIPLLAISE